VNTQASDLTLAFFVVVLGAIGTYLLLPHRRGAIKPQRLQWIGGGLTVLAVLLFGLFWHPPGPFLTGLFFYVFSFIAVGAAIQMITSRDPIHSALWFAVVVLSTSGLFLIAGAQFLAVGTVIVYAGAIIVTFLFVIMLAQMEGRAVYDRSARAPFITTLTSYFLLWALLYCLVSLKPVPDRYLAASSGKEKPSPRIAQMADFARAPGEVREVVARASRSSARLNDEDGRAKPHVASLGETLFTDSLLTVELAGALLFVALIAAISIAAPKPPKRPESFGSSVATKG